ncbi:MAG: hypothetical protein JW876_01450 [Candidatus Krumholzibacteriota bacterium]|nr:hypothetical protein [Candidatus Krumholzibacteriota bacterium]
MEQESVDRICGKIEEDGVAEIESILEKARRTAAEISEKAAAEGEAVAGKVLKDAREKAESNRRRLLSSVSLEVRRAQLKAREEIVAEILGRVEKRLGELRESGGYGRILAALVVEGVDALDGARFVVAVDRRDMALVESEVFPAVREAAAAGGRTIESLDAKPLDTPSLGGARIGVPDGKVIFDNTFEARKYRFRDEIRRIIFEEVVASSGEGGEGSA